MDSPRVKIDYAPVTLFLRALFYFQRHLDDQLKTSGRKRRQMTSNDPETLKITGASSQERRVSGRSREKNVGIDNSFLRMIRAKLSTNKVVSNRNLIDCEHSTLHFDPSMTLSREDPL